MTLLAIVHEVRVSMDGRDGAGHFDPTDINGRADGEERVIISPSN